MNQVLKAIEVLKQGGIIIFPTDTAYGIGCLMSKPEAIDRLFKLRRRPPRQAMPVLVGSHEMAKDYFAEVNPLMEIIMQEYWPGAVTVVGKCRPEKIHPPVRGYGSTIGMRLPARTEIVEIINSLQSPLLGPSANFHGEPTPYSSLEVDPQLLKLADFTISGACAEPGVSTVVDCSEEKPRILRRGKVNLESLLEKYGHNIGN